MMKTRTMLSRAWQFEGDAGHDGGNVAALVTWFVLPLQGMLTMMTLIARKGQSTPEGLYKTLALIGIIFFCLFGVCTASQKDTSMPENFVFINGGEFTMGSPEGEVGRAEARELYLQNLGIDYSETQHQVKVSDFAMSKYAVTVAEFRRFVEATGYQTDAEQEGFSVVYLGENEGGFQNGVNWRYGIRGLLRPSSEANHPVVHVSWNDAVAYCAWMSKQTGKTYRLPTEAEREYACRAGSTTPFNTGENLTRDQANIDGSNTSSNNSKGGFLQNTVSVNSFVPNALGLYNMHGNVTEWCSDWFGEHYYDACKASGLVTNPAGPSTGSDRVLRGGSWNRPAMFCRTALRNSFAPDYRNAYVGFRLVLVP